MRRLTFVLCAAALALAFTGRPARAADVTGKWTATMEGRGGGGEGMTITYNFKQDGSKLTGTVETPMGDALPISDGKVEGDKISFTLSFDRGGGPMKIEGGDFGGGDRPPATLKRVK